MKNKRLKRTRIINFLIIFTVLAAITFGLGEIINVLKTPIIDMSIYHAVLLILIARGVFWERKWKW